MRDKMWFSCCMGVFICFVLSVLFHFLFAKTGWLWTSVVSPVNESVWEHVKILFYPFLFYSIIEGIIIKPYVKQYITAKAIALVTMPFIMIALHYITTAVFGGHRLIVSIINTLICFIIAFCLSFRLYNSNLSLESLTVPSVIAVILMIILITTFTYNTPQVDIFRDSITGNYGMMDYYLKQVNDFLVLFGN